MSLATAELPADPDALRSFALACQRALQAAETAVQFRTLEIEKLKFQIANQAAERSAQGEAQAQTAAGPFAAPGDRA